MNLFVMDRNDKSSIFSFNGAYLDRLPEAPVTERMIHV